MNRNNSPIILCELYNHCVLLLRMREKAILPLTV